MDIRPITSGTYPYPSHGIHQFAGWGFAFGASASFFTSGSSLSVGGWYGLFVLFSSDTGRTALNELDVNMDAGFV